MSNNVSYRVQIKRSHLTSRRQGFTIVELLIVIVVIAILATISIVAYNGIQQRARLTVTYQYISSYQKAFMLLDAEGNLPAVNACLGPADAYPSGCADFGQSGTVKSDVNDVLKQAGASSSALPVNQLVYASNFFGYKGVMLYRLTGEGLDCGVQNIMSTNDSGIRGFYGAKNSGSGGGTTYCFVGTRIYN